MIENDEKKEKASPIDHLIRVKREAYVLEKTIGRDLMAMRIRNATSGVFYSSISHVKVDF
jgi:hypothetical protein